MPMHQGLIPREGFCADVLVRLIRQTALNPAFLLPLVLLARFTKKGENLSILHPSATGRLKTLFWLSIARWLNGWVSEKVRNNWVSDEYDWSKEIVLVTGGAGGIGGQIVKLLEEHGVTVVVLDIQPMSFTVCMWLWPSSARSTRSSPTGPGVDVLADGTNANFCVNSVQGAPFRVRHSVTREVGRGCGKDQEPSRTPDRSHQQRRSCPG